MRPLAPLRLSVVLACTLLACHSEQELRSDCIDNPDRCPPCARDSDCIIVSNECHETASCTHREREPPLAVDQIGCSSELEHERPPPEDCRCVNAVCRAK